MIFLYFQPGWIVQLARCQLGWIFFFFWSKWNQLSWKLRNAIFVLLNCFTESSLFVCHVLTITNHTMIWSQQPIKLFMEVENDLGSLERYPNHIVQLVGKSQLDRHGRMFKNIICLHPLGWFNKWLDFFYLFKNSKLPTNIRNGRARF